MSKTFKQKIVFKNTTSKDLYELYMDSKKHSAATGAPANISPEEGGKYSAHNNYINGKNLQLIKNRLIVQSWRSTGWNKDEPDSTFIIYFEPKDNDVIVHATHANVPDNEEGNLKKGWKQHYWEPWKKYLTGRPIKESIKM